MEIDFYYPLSTPNAEYMIYFYCCPVVITNLSTQRYIWRMIQYCDLKHIFYDLTYDSVINRWTLSVEHKPFYLPFIAD